MQTLILHISGMSCGHCLHAVSSALSQLPGVSVRSVRIGRAEIDYDPGAISREQISAAVADAGYTATAGGPELA